MKKIWKYVLSILLVIILASAGTIYYFLNVKTYNTADEKIEDIIESDYDIVLPGESSDGDPLTSEGTTVDSKSDSTSSSKGATSTETDDSAGTKDGSKTTNKNSNNEKNNTGTSGSKSNTKSTDKKSNSTSVETTEVTVKNIKDKYRPVFRSLESQANGKIDALLSRAVGEYHEKKANNESISYSYFYQKYTSAGRDLEGKTDAAFNYIYSALEKELKKNGYSESHAKVFREQYEETKKARESALLNKAKSAL